MDERDLIDAAHSYYVLDQTMDVIARRLGVSRSTVSRMLAEARQRGIVQITVRSTADASDAVRRRLDPFGVQGHIVPVRQGAPPLARLDAVARVASHLVSALMDDGFSLGIAWGTTTSAVVDRLPARPLRDASIVQLNGAASSSTSGLAYAGDILSRAAAAYDAHVHYFPTPAFFDDPETRRMLWRETTVRRVLGLIQRLDVALFGVGSLAAEVPSHVYTGHYLSDTDLDELRRQEVVGDVCTVFVREDGTYADITLNDRSSGPTPGVLREIPRRVCVVSGQAKVPALVGVLRARAVTDLVIDGPTASALVRHLEHRPRVADRLPA